MLREADSWKEDMLLSLGDNVQIDNLGEIENVNIIGIKFFSNNPIYKSAFREDLSKKLNLELTT